MTLDDLQMSLGDPFLNVGNFSNILNILAMKATASKLGRQSTVRQNTNMDNNILLAKTIYLYSLKHIG